MGSAVLNELVTALGLPTSHSFPYWIPQFSVAKCFPHSCPSACSYDIFTPDQMTDWAIDVWADISKMALTVLFALSCPGTGVCKIVVHRPELALCLFSWSLVAPQPCHFAYALFLAILALQWHSWVAVTQSVVETYKCLFHGPLQEICQLLFVGVRELT